MGKRGGESWCGDNLQGFRRRKKRPFFWAFLDFGIFRNLGLRGQKWRPTEGRWSNGPFTSFYVSLTITQSQSVCRMCIVLLSVIDG